MRPSLRMSKACWGVGELEEVEVLEGDGALFGHGFEVDDGLPVFGAVDDYGDGLGEFLGLREGEELEHLVEGAEAAGEDDEGLGEVGEPVLAHEEVVELEVELGGDPGVGALFEGELDVEADGLAACLEGSAVAASMMPGPPPEVMTKRWRRPGRDSAIWRPCRRGRGRLRSSVPSLRRRWRGFAGGLRLRERFRRWLE